LKAKLIFITEIKKIIFSVINLLQILEVTVR